MAFGSRLLGAAAVLLSLGSTAQAASLANANAFACGVDRGSMPSASAVSAARSAFGYGGYAGTGLDPDMPSMVKLRIIYEHADRVEIDHCGGTVIDSRWVVTAAHCVAADSSWDRVEVLAGDANLDGSGVVRRVSRDALCHGGFQYDGLKNDVALIRLDDPLPPHITPARIDSQNSSTARIGSSALTAGWPVTGLKAGSRHLNKTSVSVRNVAMPGYITAVSAMGGPEGVCRGESGGPLMAYGPLGLQLAGLLSGIQPGTENGVGGECMLAGYEMYFTPVAAYRSWIDSVRSLCDHGPRECRGSGGGMMMAGMLSGAPSYSSPSYTGAMVADSGTMLSGAPSYSSPSYTGTVVADSGWQNQTSIYEDATAAYDVAYAPAPVYEQSYSAPPVYEQSYAAEPVYQQVYSAPPVYQTAYAETPVQDVTYTHATSYSGMLDNAPVYDQVYSSPSVYQNAYLDVPTQAVTYDASPSYGYTSAPSYGVTYSETPSYQVAYAETPSVSYDMSHSVTYNTTRSTAPVYDDPVWPDPAQSYAPAEAIRYHEVAPTYIDAAAPQYEHITMYEAGYSVAYADRFTFE